MKYHQTVKFTVMAMAALALSAGSAFASVHVGGGNGTTGPNSENINTVDYDSDSSIEISNDARSDYDFELEVETGDNDFCENTEIDNIDTGDVEGDISIVNKLNLGDIDLGGSWDDWGLTSVDFENGLTGPESVNENEVDIDMDRSLEIENRADIDNDLDIDASTGNNHISHNTVVGDYHGGSVDISGTVENQANWGAGNIDLGNTGMGSINADFENHITGPNSENSNELDIDSDLDVSIENHADIDNDLDFEANTGDNTVGHNTVVGDISTGDVSIDFSVMNMAN